MTWLPSGMDLGQGLWSMAEMEFQQEANAKQRQFQKEQSEAEYRNAVEMWNATNTYNSPVEQRKRLEAAGLNPALMYGKGASPGIASPAPSIDLSKEGHYGGKFAFSGKNYGIDVQGILNAYNQLRETNANVDLKDAAARKMGAEADMANFERLFKMWDGDIDNEFFTKNPYWKSRIQEMIAKSNTAEQMSKSAKAKANMDEEQWRMYDEEGIFLNQLTNAGRVLERELGRNAAVIFDAIFPKFK